MSILFSCSQSYELQVSPGKGSDRRLSVRQGRGSYDVMIARVHRMCWQLGGWRTNMQVKRPTAVGQQLNNLLWHHNGKIELRGGGVKVLIDVAITQQQCTDTKAREPKNQHLEGWPRSDARNAVGVRGSNTAYPARCSTHDARHRKFRRVFPTLLYPPRLLLGNFDGLPRVPPPMNQPLRPKCRVSGAGRESVCPLSIQPTRGTPKASFATVRSMGVSLSPFSPSLTRAPYDAAPCSRRPLNKTTPCTTDWGSPTAPFSLHRSRHLFAHAGDILQHVCCITDRKKLNLTEVTERFA